MKYLITATDFDDTLANSNHKVSDYTRSVIERYIAAGGTFLISTGRMFPSIRKNCFELGLKGLVISCNGAMVSDIESGETLYHNPIPNADAVEQLRIVEGKRAITQIYHDNHLYVSERTKEVMGYEKVCNVTAELLPYPMYETVAREGWNLTKILCVMEPEDVTRHLKEHTAQFGDRLEFVASKAYFFEINNKGVSKGAAIDAVARQCGLSAKDVLAFGDGLNDVAMLKYAGMSYAVSNATDAAKAAAKGICLSNDEDGVAKIMEALLGDR